MVCFFNFILCGETTIYQKELKFEYSVQISWLHRASNNVETFLLPTDAHNVKKHRVIKTF